MSLNQLLLCPLLAVVALALVLIISLWEWTSFRIYWNIRKLQTFSTIPLFGTMIHLANKSPKEIFDDISRRLATKDIERHVGGILLGYPCVMLFHPQDIEVVLGSTVNITKGFEYHPMKEWLREGLLLSDGKKWKQRRKLLTPTFHFRILQDNISQIAHHTGIFINNLLATDGKPIDIEDVIKKYTLDVICETAMGIKINAQSNESQNYVTTIKRALEAMVYRVLRIWLLRDWLFNITPTGKQFLKDITTLHSFSQNIISSRREEKETENTRKETKRKAFLDILLETNESNPGLLGPLDIREEVDTFMFEGHDTTSAALIFAFYSIANHPEVQERLWEEQKEIFGLDKREPTMQELHEMHYLELVIKEVLRLYPPVPFISRKLTTDVTLGDGTTLLAGTNVEILPFHTHRMEEFWDEPEEFRPERFLQDTRRHPYAYIPFSAGPRNCIGSKFAMLEMKTTLSAVIRNCKIQPVTTKLGLGPYVILRNETPVEIKIHPRESLKNTLT